MSINIAIKKHPKWLWNDHTAYTCIYHVVEYHTSGSLLELGTPRTFFPLKVNGFRYFIACHKFRKPPVIGDDEHSIWNWFDLSSRCQDFLLPSFSHLWQTGIRQHRRWHRFKPHFGQWENRPFWNDKTQTQIIFKNGPWQFGRGTATAATMGKMCDLLLSILPKLWPFFCSKKSPNVINVDPIFAS